MVFFPQGNWEVTDEEEEDEQLRRISFLKQIIPSTRARLTVLSQSYQVQVIYTQKLHKLGKQFQVESSFVK